MIARFHFLLLVIAVAGISPAADDEANEKLGQWSKPPAEGRPWKHAGTGLSFPQMIGGCRLAGEFRYKEGGGAFIRYENLGDRARADLFFFPHPAKPATEQDARDVINRELDAVVANIQEGTRAGRYKDLILDEPGDGEIPLWPSGSAPLSARSLLVTRVAVTNKGVEEARLKQWIGVTLCNGSVITIRYTHPTDTGDAGEQALKAFAGAIFQIIKDPGLRADMKRLVGAYLADPFSKEAGQAAAAVLAYLKQTPFVFAPVPAEPITSWLDHFKKISPGAESHLLRAFVLGSAQAAMNEMDSPTCLTAGAKQFLLVYQELVKRQPELRHPPVEELAAAADKGQAAAFLMQRAK